MVPKIKCIVFIIGKTQIIWKLQKQFKYWFHIWDSALNSTSFSYIILLISKILKFEFEKNYVEKLEKYFKIIIFEYYIEFLIKFYVELMYKMIFCNIFNFRCHLLVVNRPLLRSICFGPLNKNETFDSIFILFH